MIFIKKYLGLSLFIVLLIGFFQNCQNSPSNKNSTSKTNMSGNGSGYGGKPQPGTYYATNANETCTLPGTNENTPIEAILEVKENGQTFFANGCGEQAFQEINSEQLTTTLAQDTIIGLKDLGKNFELHPQPPVTILNENHLMAACYFLPLELQPYGIIDVSLVLRNSGPLGHRTEINYSQFSENIGPYQTHSISHFNSQSFETSEGLRFLSSEVDDYALNTKKADTLNPVVDGKLEIKLNGQNKIFTALFCIF